MACRWKDDASKIRHFGEHSANGEAFGATDADDYERRASKFLCEPVPPRVLACTRKTRSGGVGDRLRYDPQTREFGIVTPNGRIRTYYEPKPNSKVPGVGHRLLTNEDYFRQQCSRVY